LEVKPASEQADTVLHAQFMSLRGGLAWVTMCRADALTYVGHLQRCSSTSSPPTYGHVGELSQLLKWLKRQPSTIHYGPVPGKPVLKMIGDSAFRAADPDCLALRGLIAGVGSDQDDCLNVLDFWSRKQTRVCRSTFAAELHNLSEAAEEGMLLAGFLQEVYYGPKTAAQLTALLESCSLQVQVWLFVDAMSVFAALAASNTQCPTEAQLLYELKALRMLLLSGRLDRLYWIDTRDMLADVLTKGKVSRTALLSALKAGAWSLSYEAKRFPLARPKAATGHHCAFFHWFQAGVMIAKPPPPQPHIATKCVRGAIISSVRLAQTRKHFMRFRF